MAAESAKFTERVTLQSPPTSQDSIGGPSGSWTDFAEVWAWIVDATGREFIAAGSTQNEALTKITIRYLAGVEPKMRAVHKGIVYNVEAVLGQDRLQLTLMCRRLEQ